MDTMTNEYARLRIWKETLKKLRLIYAMTGESMISIVDRLIANELDRLRKIEKEADG